MSNSMKDLLMGLGFKPAAQQPVSKPERNDSRERPQPASRFERKDAPRHPSQRNQSPRHPSQPRNPAHAPAQDAQKKRAEQGVRVDQPRRDSPPRTREEIDLAKAYAIRAQKEKDERIEAEQQKQEAARIKREAKAKIAEMLKDKSLSAADAELTRHFEYNGKIRRVHVTDAQLKSLNAGDLGVVQLDGRYLLVDSALAREVHLLLPSLLALLVDPNAPVADDPYADPQYQVPDDLVW
jgi:uncharacterized protein YaiL (DUF2058 family)